MACCGGGSTVVIKGGDQLVVSGSGTPSDPYIVSGTADITLAATETQTVSMKVTGSGSPNDPYIFSADAEIGMANLTDVDPDFDPDVDNVLKFDGSKWIAGPVPVSAGSVNVEGGIAGSGTGADPLRIAVSNTTETGTDGLATYIDSNGELRVIAGSDGSVAWSAITGKPTVFTPAAHTHATAAEILGLRYGTSAPADSLGVDGDWFAILE